MFLDYPWYEAPIACLFDLQYIPEPDQAVGCVIVDVLHGVVW